MAEENISFVADWILEMLTSEDLQKSVAAWNVAAEFGELERMISVVRAVLLDAKPRLQEDEHFKETFLEKLKKAVDATDEFLNDCFGMASVSLMTSGNMKNTGIATKLQKFFSMTCLVSPIVFGNKMSKAVEEVTKNLKEALSMDTSQFKPPGPETREMEPPKWEALYPEQLIGRDFHKWKIMQLALIDAEDIDPAATASTSNKHKLKVIPIVGVEGVGKTRLAHLIYNEQAVKRRFDLRMWVSNSDLGDVRLIVQKLIIQSENDETVLSEGYFRMDQLQARLCQALQGKRFFLVVDGVRDKDQQLWLILRNFFIGVAKDISGTVLVTTRSEKVGKLPFAVSQSHRLGPLDEEQSWLLLKTEAFRTHHQEEEEASTRYHLQETGKQITETCKGVPLVLLGIGKKLCRLPTNDWKNLLIKDEHQEVFGRDADRQEITKLLLQNNSKDDQFVIISIWGTAGVGKTTLAQLVFNGLRVQDYFDLRIWVSVTDLFDLKSLAEKILVSMTTTTTITNPGNLQTEELKDLICREMQGRRYLLILDDLWNQHNADWSNLEGFLAVGANGSRLVVTTRATKEVAIIGSTTTGSKQRSYKLEPLDEHSSWDLFKKVAFEKGEQQTNSKIGEEIVSKCGGNPLVIRTIGGMLYFKDAKTEWQSFYEKDLKETLTREDMLERLDLSYNHLPYHLKQCFACCCLFPNDYEIDVQTLVNLWISQGFVRTNSDLKLEDVAYDYFEELLSRSFFKETMRDLLGRITKCKMQSFMFKIAKVDSDSCETLSLKGELRGTKARHISVDFHLDSSWHIRLLAHPERNIQTLILPKQSRWEFDGRSSEAVCYEVSKFKDLRMLDLHNSGIKVVSDSIGDLKRLTYLDLSQNVSIRALPDSIGKLRNLLTLKLNHCSNLQKLPRAIKNLVNLRNLENESCYSLTHFPRGLGELTNLRTLSEFVSSKGTGSVSNLSQLEKLNDLRGKLKIKNLRCLGGDQTTRAKLNTKQHLLSLVLIWEFGASIDVFDCEKLLEDLQPHQNLRELSLIAYGGVKFSSWLPLHLNLVKFSVSGCMKCRCLPPLYHLPHLQVLVVDELPELEYISDETSKDRSAGTFFSSLKELQLTNLPKLECWWRKHEADDAVEETEVVESEDEEIEDEETEVEETVVEVTKLFPLLSKLVIVDCPNLISMPLFPHLEEVLVLKNTRWKPFEETLAAQETPSGITSEASSSSSSIVVQPFVPLSKLRTLCIINMPGVGPNMFQCLPSLRSLTLDHLREIETFLGGLNEQVANLQELHIWRCAGLIEISWIRNIIKSLRILSIKLCPNLRIQRDTISLIHSLQKVEIVDCPQVSQNALFLQV